MGELATTTDGPQVNRSRIHLPADQPIDPTLEHPYLLLDIGEFLPGRPGYKTVHKLTRLGMRCKGNRKRRVKLQTIFLYGKFHSSIEAFHRMVAEANR